MNANFQSTERKEMRHTHHDGAAQCEKQNINSRMARLETAARRNSDELQQLAASIAIQDPYHLTGAEKFSKGLRDSGWAILIAT
jgi:phosphoserine phosphatase